MLLWSVSLGVGQRCPDSDVRPAPFALLGGRRPWLIHESTEEPIASQRVSLWHPANEGSITSWLPINPDHRRVRRLPRSVVPRTRHLYIGASQGQLFGRKK